MSRSGYNDDCDDVLALGRWRSAVRSAIRGKRGQAFLKEALAVLDAMPDKRLIRERLVMDGDQARYGDPEIIVGGDELVDAHTGHAAPMGGVCLLGAVGRHRGVDMTGLDPEQSEAVAETFDIADAMAREIVFWNDEGGYYRETPEQRWTRMRAWVADQILYPVHINARLHHWALVDVSHAQICAVAKQPSGASVVYHCRRPDGSTISGTLVPGKSVRIEPHMAFTCCRTDSA